MKIEAYGSDECCYCCWNRANDANARTAGGRYGLNDLMERRM